ncbi:MAG: transposase [Candidatus Dormibacteraceae bacterium]
MEARHRARARCEDQIRCAKETGLRAFPFQGFEQNQIWLELVLTAHDLLSHFRRVALVGDAQRWEPGTLRYRLLDTAGRMVRRGRRVILRLQRNWPWTELLATAFARIRELPAT